MAEVKKRDGFLNCLAVTIQHVLLSAPQQVDMSTRYEGGRLTVSQVTCVSVRGVSFVKHGGTCEWNTQEL